MQKQSVQFTDSARKKGMRITPTVSAVYEVLEESTGPISMIEIAQKVQQSHASSVYRTVERLRKAGLIRAIPLGLKSGFELAEQFRPHHHHATCESCGKTSEIHDAELELKLKGLTKESGLSPTKHYFEVFGLCEQCRES